MNSWRLALKLAARELRRYPGRSALASLLIVLPVLVLTALASAVATYSVSPSEERSTTYRHVSTTLTAWTTTIGSDGMPTSVKATPLNGDVNAASATPTHLSKVFKAPVVTQYGEYGTTAVANQETFAGAGLLKLSGDRQIVRDILPLDSGRLPENDNEIVVTNEGRAEGMPTSGVIEVSSPSMEPKQFRVVGTVRSQLPVALASYTPNGTAGEGGSILIGQGGKMPTDLARYGLGHEMSETQLGMSDSESATTTTIVMLAIAVVAMLAAPAFAASATRNRRTLGLIAANGAPRALLGRIVLTHAAVVGALSAGVGGLVGAVLGALAPEVVYRWWPAYAPGPFDIPWASIAAIIAVAVIASVVSAVAPARAAVRTNLMQALRGQVSSRKVRAGMPLLGALLVTAGNGLLWWAAYAVTHQQGSGQTQIIVGLPLFLIGSVMIIPWLINQFGRLATYLPAPARIAVREVSRSRTRATASITAVLVTAAALSAIGFSVNSIDRHEERIYAPSAPLGDGVVHTADNIEAEVHDAVPGATVMRISAQGFNGSATGDAKGATHNLLLLDGRACSSQSIADATSPSGPPAPDVLVLPRAVVSQQMSLGKTALTALDNGGVVVFTGSDRDRRGISTAQWLSSRPVAASAIHGGRLTASNASWTSGGHNKVQNLHCSPLSLPAATAPWKAGNNVPLVAPGTVLVLESTAKSRHWPTRVDRQLIHVAGGLSRQDETRLNGALFSTNDSVTLVQVERGYESPLKAALIVLAALGGVLMLLSAVISTLLTRIESQADMATLAAVGADRGTRRRITAWQGAAICFIGSLLGLTLGGIPGVILAISNTTQGPDRISHDYPPLVAVPWSMLGITLVIVPLIAAAIVAITMPRAPSLIRREN